MKILEKSVHSVKSVHFPSLITLLTTEPSLIKLLWNLNHSRKIDIFILDNIFVTGNLKFVSDKTARTKALSEQTDKAEVTLCVP